VCSPAVTPSSFVGAKARVPPGCPPARLLVGWRVRTARRSRADSSDSSGGVSGVQTMYAMMAVLRRSRLTRGAIKTVQFRLSLSERHHRTIATPRWLRQHQTAVSCEQRSPPFLARHVPGQLCQHWDPVPAAAAAQPPATWVSSNTARTLLARCGRMPTSHAVDLIMHVRRPLSEPARGFSVPQSSHRGWSSTPSE